MEYSRNFGSTFPEGLITVGTKKDVDDTVVSLVNQYYQYMNANDCNSAYRLYKENESDLEPCSITSADFNRLVEDIFNISLYVLNNYSIIFSDTEPEYQSEGSRWIKRW